MGVSPGRSLAVRIDTMLVSLSGFQSGVFGMVWVKQVEIV